MSASIRIVVVDDHPLLREGVARSLEESGTFTIVGQGGSANDAIRLAAERDPDLILLDLSMPTARKAGAKGYVLKGVGSATLVDIVQGIADGEGYVSPAPAARLLTEMRGRSGSGVAGDSPLAGLTPRERRFCAWSGPARATRKLGSSSILRRRPSSIT